jgi:heat shock protein HtpX
MTHYDLISSNKQKSVLIVSLFITFIVLSAYIMARGLGFGPGIVGYALIFSGVMSFASYWWSDKIILGISGAHEASRKEFFDFYTVTENLCIGQRMKMPKLYVIEDSAMNAFSTGRDPEHAVVCATTGILARLNREELEGVIAHELSHVANYDIRLMSIVTILVGLLALMADWMLRISAWGGGGRRKNSDRDEGGQLQLLFFVVGLLLALLSPIIAQLIQLAISRNREFLADASGVGMTKNPNGLAKALQKISGDTQPLAEANKATAHLYICNPLKNLQGSSRGWFAGLFDTHPPVEERIQALRKL